MGWNLLFTLILPTLILMKLSHEEALGAIGALCFALSFPIGFGIFEVVSAEKPSFLTYIGLFNVLLTGGLGLMRLEGFWFAVKEATFPLIIALITLSSLKWDKTLAERILMNDMLWNLEKLHQALKLRSKEDEFQKLLRKITLILSASFILSSTLNFTLAYVLLKSEAGTAEFNQELASMQLLSYPVIVLPCLILLGWAIFLLLRSLPKLTGLSFEELQAQQRSSN